MLAWLVVVVCVVVGGRAGECPPSCTCGDADGEKDFTCGGIGVRALTNDFAKITCKNVTDLCAEMPTIPLSSNSTLPSVGLYGCPTPTNFSCLLTRLGATAVLKVTMDAPRGMLTVANVHGLEQTTFLMMTAAADQKFVSPSLLASMPALRDFRLRGAPLTLNPPPVGLEGQGGSVGSGGPKGQEGAVEPHPSLAFVELSSDGIEQLPAGALGVLKGIPQLHLWDNRIQAIDQDSFLSMEKLENLDLSRNPLTRLPPGVFSHTPRLRTLTLVATHLPLLEAGVLTGLQNLEKVTIKFGSSPMSFAPHSLANLPSLKSLTIDRCKLSPLPPDLLQGDAKLQDLILTDLGLGELPKGIFDGLISLEQLNLKDNRIAALNADVFRSLKALKQLDLSGNVIEVLPGQLLSGLRSLSSFSADHNRLSSIESDALSGAASLRRVTLADNRLTLEPTGEKMALYSEPPNSPFSALVHLRSLSLRNNLLSAMPPDWRLVLTGLTSLDLRGNLYTELTKADVQFLAANITVDLRQNRIATIDLLEAPPWWPQESNQPTGASILLDDNPFRCDCELHSFVRRLRGSRPLAAEPKLVVGGAKCSSPKSLKNFPITKLTPDKLICPLKDVDCPPKCVCNIRPATRSLELDCDESPKNYPIPSEFGLNFMHLTLHKATNLRLIPDFVVKLNLSGTGLSEISDVPETVEELDLSNNLLYRPPQVIERNMTLFLKGNPFECDCSHFEDVFLLQRNMEKIGDFENLRCNGGESPWRVNAARLCDIRRAAILGGALALLGVLIATAAALAYKYSLEIRVFLFSKGWCTSLLAEEELDQSADYDAFVSFSQKDARWVAEELVPKLEEEHNLRLCVHYRDWAVGDMIPHQIAKSVERSRRTIVVLSPSFLESSWALLEFRAAHSRAQRERRARVLVVVLEMPSAEMDEELKAYLSTNTYLEWSDPRFWQKLVYALPRRKQKMRMANQLQVANGKGVGDTFKVEQKMTRY